MVAVREMVERPASGRVFEAERIVRLGDVDVEGRLRLDAAARYLQDIAADDRVDSGIGGGIWVLRRNVVLIDRMPRMGRALRLATWCGGVGTAWAERRTDIAADGDVALRSAALWVHVDAATGKPLKLGDNFSALYGEAAGGRRVRTRLHHGSAPDGATAEPWSVRRVDLDVLGHVNNAVYWAALIEALAAAEARIITRAEVEFRDGVDAGDEPVRLVERVSGRTSVWLTVGGETRASLLAHHSVSM